MKSVKKNFKNNLEQEIKVSEFDLNMLPDNEPKKKRIHPLLIAVPAVLCTAVVAVPIAMHFATTITFDTKNELKKKTYSQQDVSAANKNTFSKINEFAYPNNKSAEDISNPYSDDELLAYNNFTYNTYKNIVKDENAGYSPMTFYGALNNASYASSRTELDTQFDELFGLNKEERISFYRKAFKNNFYTFEKGTTQLHNGAFITNSYNYNQEYIDVLTRLYCEAYQMNFLDDTDVKQMLKWVNDAINEKDFIKKDWLSISDETVMILFSTMLFDNTWNTVFYDYDNVNQKFNLADGTSTMATYMQHQYFVYDYYDYGSYISIKDYYCYGATIDYIVPKSTNDNIYDLIGDRNFLIEDESAKKEFLLYDEYPQPIHVTLKTPKYAAENELSLKDTMKSLGFGDCFDRNIDSFKNAFDDPNTSNVNIFIKDVKQKNKVSFSENGTSVKSVTSIVMDGATSVDPGLENGIDVSLDQPYIYVIRDQQGLPLYIGHCDNPTK